MTNRGGQRKYNPEHCAQHTRAVFRSLVMKKLAACVIIAIISAESARGGSVTDAPEPNRVGDGGKSKAVKLADPNASESSFKNEIDYESDRDKKRIKDVHFIAELIEEFYRKTGYYPLTQNHPLPVNVDIGNEKAEFSIATISTEALKQELQNGLKRKITIPEDPQEVDMYGYRLYQYYSDGAMYAVSAHLFYATEFTRPLADFIHKYQVSSASMPEYGLFRLKDIKSRNGGRRISDVLQAEFFAAMEAGNMSEMKSLLLKGVILNPICGAQQICKPLAVAIEQGSDIEVIEFLIANGADVNGSNAYGDTPLIYALIEERYDVAGLLVNAGADVNRPNAFGVTPFIGVCAEGNADLVKTFLRHGGNPNQSFPNRTSGGAEGGNTPLSAASISGHLEVVDLLLRNGADPSIKDSADKNALDYAKENSHKQIEELLTGYMKKKN